MGTVTPFPGQDVRAWRSVVEGMGGALRAAGHEEAAIDYALLRFRPLWDGLRTDGIAVEYPEEAKEAVEAIIAQRDRLVSRTFIAALIAFAECHSYENQ
jgi:hypothetical protein